MDGGTVAIIIILILLLFLAIGGGGYYLYKQKQNGGSTYNSPSYSDYYGGGGETQPYYPPQSHPQSQSQQQPSSSSRQPPAGSTEISPGTWVSLQWEETSPYWYYGDNRINKISDPFPANTPVKKVADACARIPECKFISRRDPSSPWYLSSHDTMIRYNTNAKGYRNARSVDFKTGKGKFRNYRPFNWKTIPGMTTGSGMGDNIARQSFRKSDGRSITLSEGKKICALWGEQACQAVTEENGDVVLWHRLKRGARNNNVKAYLAQHHPDYDNPGGFNYS